MPVTCMVEMLFPLKVLNRPTSPTVPIPVATYSAMFITTVRLLSLSCLRRTRSSLRAFFLPLSFDTGDTGHKGLMPSVRHTVRRRQTLSESVCQKMIRDVMAGRITQDAMLVVDSRIAMYKVANATSQVEAKSRLTGTSGLCIELIDRICEYGMGIMWAWVRMRK
jgi:hypothetical protein